MKSTIKVITPAKAESLLQRNTGNRTVRPRRVDQYAKQIINGQWRLTGEAIKVATDGSLLDGQHRLLAVIKAGIPTEFLVVEGLSPEVYTVLDSGLGRTVGDALAGEGFSASKEIGAVAKLVIGVQSGFNPRNTEAMALVTRPDIMAFCAEHHDLVDQSVREARTIHTKVAGSRLAWGALYALCALKHGDGGAHINEFFTTVGEGANLTAGDPRLALRNWLVRHPKALAPTTASEHLGTYLTAYRNYVLGIPTHRLRTCDVNKGLPEIPHRW